jgi:hypothetical protein
MFLVKKSESENVKVEKSKKAQLQLTKSKGWTLRKFENSEVQNVRTLKN